MDSSAPTAHPQQPYSCMPIPSWADATSVDNTPSPETIAAPNTASATEPTFSSSSSTATAPESTSSTTYPHAVDASLNVATTPPSTAGAAQFSSSHIDLLPYAYWLPHQSNVYYAQLLHYNKLVSPTRGGGLQAAPLPPVVSSSSAQAGPRLRSSSKASLKDTSTGKATASGGHGSRSHHTSDKNRPVITPKEGPPNKMAPRQGQSQAQAAEQPKGQVNRSAAASLSQAQGIQQSSSVPSTPHQRARQFSFESREPSPNEPAVNHSPRSVYSETNSTLPSLRPLPPRSGGCKYETAQVNSRRRMPYSIGNERLEKIPLGKIKGKLTEEEERKVATDMRDVYDRLLPSDKVEEKRKRLVSKLEKIFNDEWPGHDIRAHLFGSSGNLLCSDDSDVDICITTSWHDLEGVCMIADLLARRGMEKVVCISAAKVPIVKIWDPELGLACDMNVNNTLALENTRMIRIYVEIDPRVRQLMMIIKYWTRRRIINDAAFGGTLSSYTWICLVVAFLQLRTPPVLPALHQLPYKTQRPNGTHSDFADNLKKLRGYGNKNKSSEADLLFQFFRFYAHEFDYDKYVLSVRLGKMIPKSDKNWQFAVNNQLCVEEPFNLGRNLGNTADEYSFKGLHTELRRAFDLISAAKFGEVCEQYVFPKEEERVWTRPPAQPRPALLRSASQTQNGSGRGGRGGHRGGRHNHHRGGGGGGSSRRASSSVPYDNTNMFAPTVNIQQDLSWYPNPHFAMHYSQEFMAQLAYQQESYRHMHQMYAQQPAFGQQQSIAQPTMASSSNPGQASSSDRPRTNSIDNQQGPMSLPMRPELFALYGVALNSPLFTQSPVGMGAYPTSPATPTGTGPDYRRPLQRSAATTKGAPASSSALRSQSQPAARSPSAAQPALPGQALPISQSFNGVPTVGARNPSGVPIPNFIPDDADFEETPKTSTMSPQVAEEGQYSTYFPESPSASRDGRQPQGATNGIAFGDLAGQSTTSSPGRRRLSTDQMPQSILERRMRRTSRSPSPLGHSRAFSTGTASAPSSAGPTPAASNSHSRNSTRPLVVNGSGLKARMPAASRPGVPTGDHRSVERSQPTADYPLTDQGQAAATSQPPPTDEGHFTVAVNQPLAVNGSNANGSGYDEQSFRERIAIMSSAYMNPYPYLHQDARFMGAGPWASQNLVAQQPQNAVIAPLDLAISNDQARRPTEADVSLLSPVYEGLAASPTTGRKPDAPSKQGKTSNAPDARRPAWSGAVKQNLKVDDACQGAQEATKQPKNAKPAAHPPKANGARDSGHIRGARSESDGGWQKAGKGKKKAASSSQQGHAEPPPKDTSERKGG